MESKRLGYQGKFPAARTRKAALLLGVCGLMTGINGGALAQSLEEALAKAYANHPSLLAQQARVRATDEQVEQALANWRPTLNASTAISRGNTEDNTNLTEDTRKQTRTERENKLTLNQPIFRGFRTLAATDKAENKVLAERARLLGTEQTVLYDAAAAYIRTVRDKEILDLNQRNEQSFLAQVQATKTRFERGERTRTDIHQAETRYHKAISERRLAEGDYASSTAMYQTSMGMAPASLSLPAVPGGLPASKAEAVKLAEENNPSVLAAGFDEKAADEAITEAQGELLPTVGLSGTASRDFDTSAHGSRVDNVGVKLTLTMPLYDGGVAWSKVRQAKQLAHEERRKQEYVRRTAAESAAKGWDLLEAARRRIAAHQDQVASAEAAVNAIQKEMTGGTRTVVDVLDAEEDLHQARIGLARAKADQVIAAYQIKQAIGQMTAAQMNLGVDKYDPVKHYDQVRNKFIGLSSQGEEKESPAADERILKEKTAPQPAPAIQPPTSQGDEPPVRVAALREAITASDASPAIFIPEAAPAAPAAPKPAPATATTASSGRLVQLSAQRSEELAVAYWVELESAHPDIFAGLSPRIEKADLGPGKGVFHRLRTEIPDGSGSPASFCDNLKAKGVACITVSSR